MDTVYNRLMDYSLTEAYPFHMPGHKRRLEGDILSDISRIDITEIDGFDNLHDPQGIIREAQERASELYGAQESFFLINGSTCGILSAVAACVPRGGWLMMARNCHKSVYHAALLGGLKTAYLYPAMEKHFSFCSGLDAEYIKKELDAFYETHPGETIHAVLITSPTYEGVISDVRAIADFLHARRIPLIVDEAHGAHLGLAKGLPLGSCELGADIVIHSLHKTLPAMTQTALLHVNGNLVNRQKLRFFLSVYQSSSPSYVFMASIDRAVTMMQKNGEEYFESFLKRRSDLLDSLKRCKQLRVFQKEGTDPCKLVLSTGKSGMSGKLLYDTMRIKYGLQMEMAAGDYVVAILTVMDSKEGFRRLEKAVLEIDGRLEACENTPKSELTQEDAEPQKIIKAEVVCTLEEAALRREQIQIPCEEAKGRICGAWIYVYPPGIPILAPGERIKGEHIAAVNRIRQKKLDLKGICDNQMSVLK